jgi:hypothetical protein
MIGPRIEGFRAAERVTVIDRASRDRGKTGYIVTIMRDEGGRHWFQVDFGKKQKPWFRSAQLRLAPEDGDVIS